MTACHAPTASSPKKAAEPGRPIIVLVGRPNAGKSSLFNRLTGGNAHVGNFPGVTVDVLEATVRMPDGRDADVVDLPGVYSLEANVDPATDEGVARRFLDDAFRTNRPLVVVQVLDATQLALGLRLTSELVKIEAPFVLVATQRDALAELGQTIDVAALGDSVGAIAIAVSARDRKTRADVFDAVQRALEDWRDPGPASGSTPKRTREAFGYADTQRIAQRVLRANQATSAITERRRKFTARADAILLSHPFGAVIFLLIMAALFSAVFLIADPVSRFFDWSLGAVSAFLLHRLGHSLVVSFFTDAVLGGAGTVLTFVPQIVILTMLLDLLDASGYLARGAFIADRILRLLGLGGRSFVPLLLGHACAIPAIAATRVIRNPQERLVTILVIPLMTCSARIPTYALVLGVFFSTLSPIGKAAIFVSLYALGGIFGFLASIVLRGRVVRGKSLPLVMEMPSYRWPEPIVLARKGWQAATNFTRSAGTTILAASAVLWLLLHIPVVGSTGAPAAVQATAVEQSMAASIGRALEPVTRPLGFDWRINVGLIGSFGSREMMVGTLGVIHGVESTEDRGPLSQKLREAKGPDGRPAYSTRTGLALLAFFVIACQCISTVVAVGRETKSIRWPIFVIGYTYALAYLFALATSAVAGRLGL